MKGQDFGATQRLERAYGSAIKRLLSYVLPKPEKAETFDGYLHRLSEVSQREDVREVSEYLAGRMVRWVNVLNTKGWRAAANKTQRTRHLHSLLMREMGQATGSEVTRMTRVNASYISSIPRQAAEQLGKEVLRAQQAGARPGTIAKMLQRRYPKLLRSKIALLSRTETQKASLALTQSRAEDLNLPFYIWSTSEDQRVRLSHRRLNNVVIPWAEPPSPEKLFGEPSIGNYHAGGVFNCRCTQIVVLGLDDIHFPASVYWHGAVRNMTRSQFKTICGAHG